MKGSRRAPLFLFFGSGFILSLYLLADFLNLVVADLLVFTIRDIIVDIQMQEILRLHVVLISHAEGTRPGCDAL